MPRPLEQRRRSLLDFLEGLNGKPEAYRTVLRQSRDHQRMRVVLTPASAIIGRHTEHFALTGLRSVYYSSRSLNGHFDR